MPVKEVTALRRAGRLEEAYDMAARDLAEEYNEWTAMSMFWTLREMVQKVLIPGNETEKAREFIGRMGELLPDMKDDAGYGERTYQTMIRHLDPHADAIRALGEQAKTDPSAAYERAVDICGIAGEKIEKSLHNDYGWIIWRYLKACGERLTQEDIGNIFSGYLKMSVERPSMLHSLMLSHACRLMKEENAVHFALFLKEWYGDGNFREEDWEGTKAEDGKEYQSLAAKAVKKCMDSLKADPAAMNDSRLLSWADGLCCKVMELDPDDGWTARDHAMILIWKGDLEGAAAIYKNLLTRMGEKYYLWAELSGCIQDNNRLRTGLLLKALNLERNEDYLGDIHLALASAWIMEGRKHEAERQLQIYQKHRHFKGWNISSLYSDLLQRVAGLPEAKDRIDHRNYISEAEDYVYADLKKTSIAVVDNVNEDKKLFHIILKTESHGSIIFYNKTKLRPAVGDLLQVSYISRKAKDDTNKLKFINIQKTDVTDTSLARTVSGRLKIGCNRNAGNFSGSSDAGPDFAFVEGCYVQRSLLRRHRITGDCNVTAKALADGNGKWRVYEIEVK